MCLERFIGECGIHDTKTDSPTGSLDSIELLAHAKRWGSICVAAHVAAKGGLLRKLNGQPRANAWKSPDLLACALPALFPMRLRTSGLSLRIRTRNTSGLAP